MWASLWAVAYFLIHLGFVARAIQRPHREPASRIAWVVTIMVLPVAGILAYLLLGETNIGRRRVARSRQVLARIPSPSAALGADGTIPAVQLPERYEPLFRMGRTVNGFEPCGGNRGELTPDSNAMIDRLVADIDAARRHVHLCFYIWLADRNGLKVVEALCRAAARGVTCRALADALGSRTLIAGEPWRMMRGAGVKLAAALPIGNPLLKPLRGRIDLRNHRKIVVIDNGITYCGSQNCADPEFRVKAKYAPWVDAVIRFEGPIARQNQALFVADWMDHVDEDLTDLLREPLAPAPAGFAAQVIGTGPTIRYSAMPEVFETLMYAARQELTITTPYFVPDEAMLAALCASARRGVATTLIVPLRNDSWIVAAASRSYYAELLGAGVQIFEYPDGLLHTKSLTLDGQVTLIGSANMDRRSFELNYENNILLCDPQLTADVRNRQAAYLARSQPVTLAQVAAWSLPRVLLNNAIGMMGPVL
ncbi:MAG: cardiolipin synthase [Pirellulales bacterium]|nr:cardiolipin synthase [Pirellulales bacterium]